VDATAPRRSNNKWWCESASTPPESLGLAATCSLLSTCMLHKTSTVTAIHLCLPCARSVQEIRPLLPLERRSPLSSRQDPRKRHLPRLDRPPTAHSLEFTYFGLKYLSSPSFSPPSFSVLAFSSSSPPLHPPLLSSHLVLLPPSLLLFSPPPHFCDISFPVLFCTSLVAPQRRALPRKVESLRGATRRRAHLHALGYLHPG